MGYYMARNLARHKHSHPAGSLPLLVYNRTRAKSEQLQKEVGQDRVEIADSPEQLAEDCDVIFTNLASDAVVVEVYTKFKNALSVSIMWYSTMYLLTAVPGSQA